MTLWPLLLACSSHDLAPDRPASGQGVGAPPASAVLNEVEPSNRATLIDADGDSVDWIELANAGDTPVDLAGWTLSDDPDEPQMWTLPSVALDPGELLLVYASGKDQTRLVASWDTRIDLGDRHRYLAAEGPVEGWTRPDFDDSAWPEGPSGFGRGDEDDATGIDAHTVYSRATFALTSEEADDLSAMMLHIDYDDGFVAWIDGEEVARANLAGDHPAWNDWATAEHEARIVLGEAIEGFDLADVVTRLGCGAHTLAVEVHDLSAESTDLSLVPILTLGFDAARPGRTSTVVDLAPLGLHTNFELRADGEPVRLFDPAGALADAAEPVPLLADESYGRQPDATGSWHYFLHPTPGEPNTAEGRAGFAVTPTLDPAGGFFPRGTDIAVTAAPGQQVRATYDGREPTEDDPVVPGEVSITEGEAVVLRVRAFDEGLWPSRTGTATVLLRDPGVLPVISLATEPDDLWSDATGIHVFGTHFEPDHPYYGANFWEEWERPVHVELWEPDATRAFSVAAGLSINGSYSRAHEQKNLDIDLGPGWGDEEIEYEVFPGLGIREFERLLLRAAGNDWLGCFRAQCSQGAHLRDALAHRLTAGADLDAMAYRPAEVYLDGVWFGIYEIREKPDLAYLDGHHGVEDVDLLETWGSVIEGDDLAWEALLELLRGSDLSDPVAWAVVEAQVDVDELATYLAFEVFFDNTDWPGNNIKYWRPRTATGRWRWLLYDVDFGLGADGADPGHDTLAFALDPAGPEWPNPPSSTELFRLMMTSPAFVATFANIYADLLNTQLDPAVTRATLGELADAIAADMPRHAERWGSWTDGSVAHALPDGVWEEQVAGIDAWLAARPAYAREHVVANLGLGGTFPLTLDADPPGSATFRLTAAEVAPPFSGVAFQDVPVAITAVPANGYTFVGWSDLALGSDPTLAITADSEAPVSLVARFE